MSIQVFTNSTPAIRVLTSKVWTRIHIQVQDANTLYIGTDKKILETAGATGIQQGLGITKAMGIVTLPWIGELWAMGSAAQTLVDIEVLIPPGAGAGS